MKNPYWEEEQIKHVENHQSLLQRIENVKKIHCSYGVSIGYSKMRASFFTIMYNVCPENKTNHGMCI